MATLERRIQEYRDQQRAFRQHILEQMQFVRSWLTNDQYIQLGKVLLGNEGKPDNTSEPITMKSVLDINRPPNLLQPVDDNLKLDEFKGGKALKGETRLK